MKKHILSIITFFSLYNGYSLSEMPSIKDFNDPEKFAQALNRVQSFTSEEKKLFILRYCFPNIFLKTKTFSSVNGFAYNINGPQMIVLKDQIISGVWNKNVNKFIAGTKSGKLYESKDINNLDSFEEIDTIGLPDNKPINHITVDNENNIIYFAIEKDIYSLDKNRKIEQKRRNYPKEITAIAIPDQNQILVGSGKTLYLHSFETDIEKEIKIYDYPIKQINLSPDGTRILVLTFYEADILSNKIDLPSDYYVKKVREGSNLSASWGPDSNYFVVSAKDEYTVFHDALNKKSLDVIHVTKNPIDHILWNPTNFYNIVYSIENTVYTWTYDQSLSDDQLLLLVFLEQEKLIKKDTPITLPPHLMKIYNTLPWEKQQPYNIKRDRDLQGLFETFTNTLKTLSGELDKIVK